MASTGSNRGGNAGRSGSNVKGEAAIRVKLEDGEGRPASNSHTPTSSGNAANAINGRPKKETSPPPPTTYRDIALKSSTLDDWRYHLMRFASHAVVNPGDAQQFPFPVKLNRKWPPKLKDPLPRAGDPVLDQFGKPILVPAQRREPGQPAQAQVALTATEKKRIPLLWPGPDDDVDEVEELVARLDQPKGPQADASLIGPSSSSNNATRAKAGLFQKRVREIHKASAAARRTHNEEALPWILEDNETTKDWESRRKESRRGLKALQLGIKARRDGGSFPSLPRADEDTLRAESIAKEEDSKLDVKTSNENHAPWIGKLEGEAHESGSTSAGGAMSHALFVFDEREAGSFRLVPVTRMYKFLQRPKHANKMSWEDAEKAFEQHQKARLGEASKWTVSNDHYGSAGRRAGGGSGAGHGGVKSEGGGNSILARLTLPASAGPSRPDVKTIYDRDAYQRRNQFVAVSGESKRSARVKDEEGTYGEIDFEEDFADDEERHEGDDFAMNEEEAKELEQRLKREMARAEEEQENDDEGDDLFDERGRPGRGENDVLTGSGKQMKKIMKALARREGNDVYDDDDEERNPYLSDESDGGEDSVMANPEEALRRVREEREREAREAAKNNSGSQPATNGASAVPSKSPSKAGSRSGTPGPRSTTEPERPMTSGANASSSSRQHGGIHKPGAGHANVAQRATSPTAISRQGSRSGSPVRDVGGSSSTLKRKSEIGTPSGHKRMRTGTSGSASQPGSPGSASPRSASPSRGSTTRTNSGTQAPLSEWEREIIQLVRQGKAKTTKELISHFSSRFKGPEMNARKKTFFESASRVLTTKTREGTLDIRPGF
jgi:transcription initiation factor TFIIF subunit alpha